MNTVVLDGEGRREELSTISLLPLNRTLLVIPLNESEYDESKARGDDSALKPNECGSMIAAGYRYRPTTEFKPMLSGFRFKSTPDGRVLESDELLPGSSDPQTVAYGENLTTEDSLGDHFRPSGVERIARSASPPSPSTDRPGIFLRLRALFADYEQIAMRLQQEPSAQLPSYDELEMEKNRLKAMLKIVRDRAEAELERELTGGRGTDLPESQKLIGDINRNPAENASKLDQLRELARLRDIAARRDT